MMSPRTKIKQRIMGHLILDRKKKKAYSWGGADLEE